MRDPQQFEAFMQNYQNMVFSIAMRLVADATEVFAKAAADAKAGCPISKLFDNNTEILLDAKLV